MGGSTASARAVTRESRQCTAAEVEEIEEALAMEEAQAAAALETAVEAFDTAVAFDVDVEFLELEQAMIEEDFTAAEVDMKAAFREELRLLEAGMDEEEGLLPRAASAA